MPREDYYFIVIWFCSAVCRGTKLMSRSATLAHHVGSGADLVLVRRKAFLKVVELNISMMEFTNKETR